MEIAIAGVVFGVMFVAFAVLPTQIRKHHQRRAETTTIEKAE